MFESREARYWPRVGQYCLLDTPDARVRLAATTTMASTLAHEVTQPLTAAANYLYACARRLRSRGEGEQELLMMIEHANRETQKAAEIIRRMRAFIVTGRIAGRRENLRTMVERVAAGLMVPGSSEIEIVRDISLTHYVTADRVQIEQVLSNLLRNACEAIADQARRRIAITARREGRDVVVRIEDNGPGLEPDALARLFEPQFTTKPNGLGLGLPICKTIVEAHGGRIWAENVKGGGAAFHLALPADDGDADDSRGQGR